MTAPGILDILSPLSGERERSRAATDIAELPARIGRARAAQRQWAATSMRTRKQALQRVIRWLADRSEDVAARIHRYNGKTADEALLAEVYPTLATFRYFRKIGAKRLRPQRVGLAAAPLAHSKIHFEPLGVIGVIAPWNYPFKVMLQDVPAALMAGNAVMLRTSEHSTAIGELVEELCAGAALPDDLVQVLYGHGDLGAALIDGGIDKVVFTGSTKTGRRVHTAAAAAGIPCTLELGGKDAAIVLDDADLDDCAEGILWAGLANRGQTCASVETVWVPEVRRAALLDKLSARLAALPSDALGTMNVAFQRDIVRQQVAEARERGAQVVAESPHGDPPAMIVTDVPADCALAREETFGPVLDVRGYKQLDEPLGALTDSEYGLTASVWTTDDSRGLALAERIDAGTVTINEHMLTAGMPEAPWGGHKQSGLGVAMSYLSLYAFSKIKYVFRQGRIPRLKFWRMPYDERKRALMRRVLRAEFGASALERARNLAAALPALLAGKRG